MKDNLDSREFYELCQQYRTSMMGVQEFEAIKDWIRRNVAEIDRPFCYLWTRHTEAGIVEQVSMNKGPHPDWEIMPLYSNPQR